MTEENAERVGGAQTRSRILLLQFLQYGVAIGSVALALGINRLLYPYLEPTPTPTFFAAVMVSAWYGGFGPGLLATALSVLVVNHFYIQPLHAFDISNWGYLARLSVFVMAALLISSLNQARRSAQVKAEASLRSLRASEARFGCLAEANIIGMLVADLDGAILEANSSFLAMLGYGREALRAGQLNWREITPPEFLARSEQAAQELRTTGVCAPFEKEYFRKDGRRVAVLHGGVMTGANTVTGFVLDLSEQKRMETAQQEAVQRAQWLQGELQTANDQLETILASLNDQFFVLDREWRYLYVSDRVVEMVGKSRSELLGECIWDLFPDIVGSQFYVELQRAATEQRTIRFEYFYPTWQRWFENHVYSSRAGISVLATDITERKQAEERLQRTNQTLQTLLEACPVAIAFLDPQGIVKLWNRAAEQIFGWSAAEAVGQFMPSVAHRQSEFLASVENVLSGRSLDGLETQHQRKNGQLVDLEIWANLTHDAEGNVGCLGIAWDITERKRVQQELQQTLQTLQTVFAASPLPIVVIALDQTVTLWNPAAENLFGWCEAEMIGQPLPIVPLERAEECRQIRAAIAQGKVFLGLETYRCKRDGVTVSVNISAAPLYDDNGTVNAMLLIFQDITERQQAEANLRDSEERLRLALTATNQGLYDLNVQTGDAVVSPAYAEMLGFDPDGFLETNAKWRDRLHPEDVAVVQSAYEDYLAGKLDAYRVEFRQRAQTGAWKWILSTGKIVAWDDDGRPLRMLGTHIDITARKQAETEREQLLAREQAAREQAETANRIKDEFLAVLSHELRSPLNPILGWARLLQTQKLSEQKTQQALATIERNAKLQTQLIEDLLDVSRILRGKLVLNIAPVNLRSTVEAALETVNLAIETKGIHLHQTFTLEPDQVMGDAARLQQVIWNLLTNAVKFTPPGGQVEVRLEGVSGEAAQAEIREAAPSSPTVSPAYAQITVRDSGKGIAPAFLPYVFDYFRQEDGSTTRQFGGLGLGLAIVRHLTELHGGSVRADSPGEDQGATFIVRLPLMPIAVNVETSAEAVEAENLVGLKILAVDDDADIRTLIEFILMQAGAEVRVVASATAALEALEAFSPDVLISDIGMPEFDGYMLMQHIKSHLAQSVETPNQTQNTLLGIALTAYAGEVDQQRAIAAGFQMHLAKPIEPEKLIGAIVALVKAQRANSV